MLSEGRSRDFGCLVGMVFVGVVSLAFVGGFVTVRALVEWLT